MPAGLLQTMDSIKVSTIVSNNVDTYILAFHYQDSDALSQSDHAAIPSFVTYLTDKLHCSTSEEATGNFEAD